MINAFKKLISCFYKLLFTISIASASVFSQATVKPQYVEQIAKTVKGTVGALLEERVENDNLQFMIDLLGMHFFEGDVG